MTPMCLLGTIRVLVDTNTLLANLRGHRPSNALKLVLAEAIMEIVAPDRIATEKLRSR